MDTRRHRVLRPKIDFGEPHWTSKEASIYAEILLPVQKLLLPSILIDDDHVKLFLLLGLDLEPVFFLHSVIVRNCFFLLGGKYRSSEARTNRLQPMYGYVLLCEVICSPLEHSLITESFSTLSLSFLMLNITRGDLSRNLVSQCLNVSIQALFSSLSPWQLFPINVD